MLLLLLPICLFSLTFFGRLSIFRFESFHAVLLLWCCIISFNVSSASCSCESFNCLGLGPKMKMTLDGQWRQRNDLYIPWLMAAFTKQLEREGSSIQNIRRIYMDMEILIWVMHWHQMRYQLLITFFYPCKFREAIYSQCLPGHAPVVVIFSTCVLFDSFYARNSVNCKTDSTCSFY